MPKNTKLLQAFKAVKVTDTTLRDGHQSTIATRMRTEDMLPIAEKMDRVGFHTLEVWGGRTFDVATRYLNEDPWERLVELKKRIKKTPLQMLLRGQNLVGYRNYADDVVEAFVERAAETGIDIFRVFDALNDERNFEASFKAIKKVQEACSGHDIVLPHRPQDRGQGIQPQVLPRKGQDSQGDGRGLDLHQGHGGDSQSV